MPDRENQIGRLAFRQEGAMWNAYWAKPNTMDGATLLGSIKLSIVTADPQMKGFFIELMRIAIAMATKELGIPVDWGTELQRAPEHERAGNA